MFQPQVEFPFYEVTVMKDAIIATIGIDITKTKPMEERVFIAAFVSSGVCKSFVISEDAL